MADDAKTRVSFSLSQAKRIAAVVKRVEHSYRSTPPAPARGPLVNGDVGKVAKTGPGGIPAMSGTTVGIGDVTLYTVSESGELTASDITTSARNLGGAVAGNKFVLVAPGPWGWWVVVEPCTT